MAGAKRKRSGPDWKAVKALFVAGVEAPELADRFGINLATLRSRITRGNWREERNEIAPTVQQECIQRAAEIVVEESGEWIRESLRMAREARAELWAAREQRQQKIVSSPDGPVVRELAFRNSPADWRAFVAALDALDAMGRRALKLDEPAPPVTGAEGPGAGVVIVPADTDDWRSIDGSPGDGG